MQSNTGSDAAAFFVFMTLLVSCSKPHMHASRKPSMIEQMQQAALTKCLKDCIPFKGSLQFDSQIEANTCVCDKADLTPEFKVMRRSLCLTH